MLNILEENKKRDIFLTDGKNCYFFPKGWCCEDGNGVYGYIPLYSKPNSEVISLFCPIELLIWLDEVDEKTALRIHPRIGDYHAPRRSQHP